MVIFSENFNNNYMDNTFNKPFYNWPGSYFEVQGQDRQDRHQEEVKNRETQRNREVQDKTGHWSEKQNSKYYAFLKRFSEMFSQRQLRRQYKVFKALSKYIQTRNPNQCRSHHHKMTKNFQTIELALENVRLKSSGLYSRAEKYFQELRNIEFNSFQDQQFVQDLELQEKKQKQFKDIEINQVQKRGQNYLQQVGNNKSKAQDIALMKTGATVEPIEEHDKQMPYNIPCTQYPFSNQSMFMNFGQMNNPYLHQMHSFGYQEPCLSPEEETQLLLLAHEHFTRWADIMNYIGSRRQ